MELNILCWNICWGCMSSNDKSKHDSTAKTLAQQCYNLRIDDSSNKNICLSNVVELIDKKNYDFIGLQEATKWQEIYNDISYKDNLGYVHHYIMNDKNAKIELATFYNKKQFKVLAVKTGNLNTTNDVRPYHIIFLQNNTVQPEDNYILINLHNGHGIPKNDLETKLSKDINNAYNNFTTQDENKYTFSPNTKEYDITGIINDKIFKIIVMGDFNDHGNHEYWKGLQPFKNTNFDNLKNIIVKSTETPPLTCCTGNTTLRSKSSNNDTLYGDYILINDKLSYQVKMKIPDDYDADKYTSDHLPIETTLKSDYPEGKITTSNLPNEFKLNKSGVEPLRLLNDSKDPNIYEEIDKKYHKGQNIDENDILIYPNGSEIDVGSGEKLVFVVSEADPNKIGYVRTKYLSKDGHNNLRINHPTRSKTRLRLLSDIKDPNVYPIILCKFHFGQEIDNGEVVYKPNGEVKNGYVIVQKKNDSSVIGYVNKNNLVVNNITKHVTMKYLKYKNKYKNLKLKLKLK